MIAFYRRKKKHRQRACRQELNQFAFENSIYMVASRMTSQGQGHTHLQRAAQMQTPVTEPIYATIEPIQRMPKKNDIVWYNIQSRLSGQVHFNARPQGSSSRQKPTRDDLQPEADSHSSVGESLPDTCDMITGRYLQSVAEINMDSQSQVPVDISDTEINMDSQSQVPVDISDTEKLVQSVDVMAV